MSIDSSYNAWASTYDTNENKTRDLDKIATQGILRNFRVDNILEIGCGTGKNTEWLSEHAQSHIGLDFSENMLAIAREKITAPHVQFVQADILNPWPVPDNFADLISCNLVLEHIENLEPVFLQAFHKIKKGGSFFTCELHPARQYKGSQAKFETGHGTEMLKVFIHHITDYTEAAEKAGFKLVKLNEWFDEERENKMPRLISFLFARSQ